MRTFDKSELKKLHKPHWKSSNEDNGQVTIIGGSKLFHGAPLLALKVASRIVDMVFFASPDPSVGEVASQIKSRLMSFVWVPWQEADAYILKSDAVLIGPGFMRFGSEHTPQEKRKAEKHKEGQITKKITESFLGKFPHKRWVIDAGSLQVIKPDVLPKEAIITPNAKEYKLLFDNMHVEEAAKKFDLTITLKGPETIVCSPKECMRVTNGNPGMTKGGTGDVLAGLTVALLAKNEPFLAAASASYVAKAAADALYEKFGVNYNADDLADKIPETLQNLLK